jgi:hypothetical protein
MPVKDQAFVYSLDKQASTLSIWSRMETFQAYYFLISYRILCHKQIGFESDNFLKTRGSKSREL